MHERYFCINMPGYQNWLLIMCLWVTSDSCTRSKVQFPHFIKHRPNTTPPIPNYSLKYSIGPFCDEKKMSLVCESMCDYRILTVSLPKNMTTGVHNSVKDPWRGFPESMPIDMENQVKERSMVLSCVIPTGADLVTAILSEKKLLLFSWIPQSSFFFPTLIFTSFR